MMFKTVFFAVAAALVTSVAALPTLQKEVHFAIRYVLFHSTIAVC